MVLVNAIYFKGGWMKKFDKKATKDGKFKLHPASILEIQMMFQEGSMKYGQNDDLECKIIEVPYANNELSMFIILPNNINGLPDLEKKITATSLAQLTADMRYVDVHLSLPRFKLEHSFSVKDMLYVLGIKDMFSPNVADFSKMDGTKQMFVSAILHKSFIEVNEEGSEAAAATVVMSQGRCRTHRKPIPVDFIADHPFLFLIRENRSKGILFMGRVTNPE